MALKIVVDAMGGDHAPQSVIAGVIEALSEIKSNIVLVGIKEDILQELHLHDYPTDRIEIIHAPDVVLMDDPATVSIRKKRNSSLTQGICLLKEPGYDAFISAGNTGAVVAASTIHLGMLEGVERPAIGLTIPTLRGFSFLIDVGANTDPKPKHLLQSALMARVYSAEILGVENPSVGMLNIGAEEGKGTGFAKDTYKLLKSNIDQFTGNVEASEVYSGKTDCIVCDGFVGNVVLKVSEGLMESAGQLVKREVKKRPLAMLGAFLMKKSLAEVKKKVDYAEYGGAPLLGVNGLVMISHGRSSPKAIKNAIKATEREIEHNILARMRKEIAAHQPANHQEL